MTSRNNGATGMAYGEYLMEMAEDPNLEEKCENYVKAG